MRSLKHLPLDRWSKDDIDAFAKAYEPGDIFDETAGPGAHLTEGTRRILRTAWRRWLGFLKAHYPADLLMPPADRITQERVRTFIEQLNREVRPSTVAHVVGNLCYGARLIAPERNWNWLVAITARLAALARPLDRFGRLVPPWHILDYGIELMETAPGVASDGHLQSEIQYRNGLLLALISLWLIRRRSIEALTVSRHLEFDAAGVNILLYPEDTKAKRDESFRVPEQLLPYLLHYLKEIRPRFRRHSQHDGLWASYKGCPLTAGRVYDIFRELIMSRFGKDMGLHDIRRAGATFIATDAPDKIGLIPGMLQHASADVGERYYNLSQSVAASRRHAAHLAKVRDRLRRSWLGTRVDPCAP